MSIWDEVAAKVKSDIKREREEELQWRENAQMHLNNLNAMISDYAKRRNLQKPDTPGVQGIEGDLIVNPDGSWRIRWSDSTDGEEREVDHLRWDTPLDVDREAIKSLSMDLERAWEHIPEVLYRDLLHRKLID